MDCKEIIVDTDCLSSLDKECIDTANVQVEDELFCGGNVGWVSMDTVSNQMVFDFGFDQQWNIVVGKVGSSLVTEVVKVKFEVHRGIEKPGEVRVHRMISVANENVLEPIADDVSCAVCVSIGGHGWINLTSGGRNQRCGYRRIRVSVE